MDGETGKDQRALRKPAHGNLVLVGVGTLSAGRRSRLVEARPLRGCRPDGFARSVLREEPPMMDGRLNLLIKKRKLPCP